MNKIFIGICKKQIQLPNSEYLRNHRFERTNLAYKCKIFVAVTLTHHGHYTHVYRFKTYWNKYRK